MVKTLLTLLVLLLGGLLLALVISRDPGHALLSYGDWSLETSLALLLGVIVAGYFVVNLLVRLVRGTIHLPRNLRERRERRSVSKARQELTQGLLELAEGHWAEAEKHLNKHVEHCETPLLNYLASARAAQHQGAHDRRDRYLRQAFEAMPSAEIAIGLTQAELQMGHQQNEQALATLNRLRSLSPQHAQVIKMLATVLERMQDWPALVGLLAQLRANKIFDEERLQAIERKAISGRLQQLGQEGDEATLSAFWNQLKKVYREDEVLLTRYIQQLAAHNGEAAEKTIRQRLGKHWNEELARLYGHLPHPSPGHALATAEGWLKEHPHSPMLLLTLGRLSAEQELWGKARQYLEASLGYRNSTETHGELALLLERMNEFEAARKHYRQGLEQALDQSLS